MTTVTRDPRMFPVYTGTSAQQLRDAVEAVIAKLKADAAKLERFGHHAYARPLYDEAHHFEALLCSSQAFDLLAQQLREMTMSTGY